MSRNKSRPVIKIAAPIILAAVLLFSAIQFFGGSGDKPPASAPLDSSCPLNIVMLDVGQGDSILISSGGQYALIDAGENDRGDDVVEKLKAYGVTKLAAVFGTHPHSDHIGGMDTVLDSIPTNMIYLSPLKADTETYEDVLDAADRKRLKITIPKPGDSIRLGEAEITVLWPPVQVESDNDNNGSLVLRVQAAGHSALLCGDIEKEAERALLGEGASLGCDVLKVAHHGSDTSSTKAFIKAAAPQIALISVGTHNDYRHPDTDVLSRLANAGAKYYRTDLKGDIIVNFGSGGVEVKTQR